MWGRGALDTKAMVGARIRDIRTKNRITQEQLAEKMVISAKYLSSIERGKENPTLKYAHSAGRGFGRGLGCGIPDLEMEDQAKRRELVLDMLRNADEDQMRMIARFLGAVLGR